MLPHRPQGAGRAGRQEVSLPFADARRCFQERAHRPSRLPIFERIEEAAMSTATTGRPPQDCKDLSEVRVEIDRCDRALVEMIAERFGYVERAWQIKLGLNQEANVPWRNQQVFDRVRKLAEEKGIPPDMCEALWRQMVGWFIQYEEEKLKDEIAAKAGKG
jgi:isochorismate pyruvate lyase